MVVPLKITFSVLTILKVCHGIPKLRNFMVGMILLLFLHVFQHCDKLVGFLL